MLPAPNRVESEPAKIEPNRTRHFLNDEIVRFAYNPSTTQIICEKVPDENGNTPERLQHLEEQTVGAKECRRLTSLAVTQ